MTKPTDKMNFLEGSETDFWPSKSSQPFDENLESLTNVQQWEADLHETQFYDLGLEKLDADSGCGLSLGDDLSFTLSPFKEESIDCNQNGTDPGSNELLDILRPISITPLVPAAVQKRPRKHNTRSNYTPKTKRLKMYELDIPEAKNAKAAFLNRMKKKQELHQLQEQNELLILRMEKATAELAELKDKCCRLQTLLKAVENKVPDNVDQCISPTTHLEQFTKSLNRAYR